MSKYTWTGALDSLSALAGTRFSNEFNASFPGSPLLDRASKLEAVLAEVMAAGAVLPGVQPVFNVKAYGAVADDSTDSYSAFAACATAAAAFIAGTGASAIFYVPPGGYRLSAAVTLRQHGLIVECLGILRPFGSFAGPLVHINGDSTTRPNQYDNGSFQAKIDVRHLRIDGRDIAAGVTLERIDHSCLQNIYVTSCLGRAVYVRQVRESDFYGVTIFRSNGNGAPNLHLYEDSSYADPSNGLRFFGLNVSYCADQALVVDTDVVGGNPREINFYGAQLHYLDSSATVASFPFSNTLNLVELKKGRDFQFWGGNIRIGLNSNGTALKLGDSGGGKSITDSAFNSVVISGDGATPTGINGSSLANVQFNHCANRIVNGTFLTGSSPEWYAPRRAITLTYSANMTPDPTTADAFKITVTDASAMTINAPAAAKTFTGMEFSIEVANASGGAMGAITWSGYFLAGAFTNPATGKSRTITFRRIAGAWKEFSRGAADL